MAKVINAEIDIKTGAATKAVDDLAQGIENFNAEVATTNTKAAKGFKSLNTAVEKTSRGFKGLGNALKAAGIGLAIAAFAKLSEVFRENQKVTNFFNTTFEALSLAFNDFFNFLNRNVGTVIDYFRGLFEDPVTSLKNFGTAIVNNVVERVRSALDALGFLGDAVVKVFQGDFAGAAESAKNAGKELVDVVTGVDDSFEKIAEAAPAVVKGITDYAKSTVQAAKDTVELNRAAEIGIAQNRIILEQKDREAEKLRQIRDDETKTIAERIKANEDLAKVLEEQEKLMLANAQAVIDAAQAQFDKNANDENQIALLDAKAEKEGILAQIEGFRSEQLINRISLEREAADLREESLEKEIELEKEARKAREEKLLGIAASIGMQEKMEKVLFIAQQKRIIQEQIAQAKATLARITMKSSESGVATAQGAAETAKVGFPQNVPLLIAFAAQAAGILSAVKSAASAAKSVVSSSTPSGGGGGGDIGGGGGGTPPPAFNIVGAAPENQLAESIGAQQDRPIKAFVTSTDVSSQQALDRSIEDESAI
tara:strand:- start:4405 stop:6024 length:1620 start_codon:yes stop_codon:yes gene_type:complete